MRTNSTNSYGSSLLLGQDSHGTGNVLAHHSDLSKLGGGSLGDLGHTQLNVTPLIKHAYLRKLLLERLNLVHELITVLLTKFNGLHSGYTITNLFNSLPTHFSISIALFAGEKQNSPPDGRPSGKQDILQCLNLPHPFIWNELFQFRSLLKQY